MRKEWLMCSGVKTEKVGTINLCRGENVTSKVPVMHFAGVVNATSNVELMYLKLKKQQARNG